MEHLEHYGTLASIKAKQLTKSTSNTTHGNLLTRASLGNSCSCNCSQPWCCSRHGLDKVKNI